MEYWVGVGRVWNHILGEAEIKLLLFQISLRSLEQSQLKTEKDRQCYGRIEAEGWEEKPMLLRSPEFKKNNEKWFTKKK